MPADDGTGGVEVSGNNYARVAATNNTTTWPATTTGIKRNGIALTFPTPSGAWGTVIGFGIYDASSAGNLLFYGTLPQSIAPTSGKVVRFAINAMQVVEQ
jgi:hypothetical protein